MLPDFIGIGSQKCGTTWTARELKAHPEVWIGEKELRFLHTERPIEEYKRLFKNAPANKKKGEITPEYMLHTHVADKIQNWMGNNIKLFVILRNPIDRAFSHWKQGRDRGTIPKHISLIQAFRDGWPRHGSLKERGVYNRVLERYMTLFKNKLHISFYDDLITDPVKFIQTIYEHIEVDPNFQSSTVKTWFYDTHNTNPEYSSSVISKEDREEIGFYYEKSIKELEILTGRQLVWQ